MNLIFSFSPAALSRLLAVSLTASFLAGTALRAQPAPPAADSAWAAVKNAGRANNTASALIADADALKSFQLQYPAHAQAVNAKCLEAIALLRAWLVGDTTQDQRRGRLIAEVRNNKSADISLRAEVFALADSADIAKRPGLSRDQALLSYEQATRALIAEFPTLPNGYEALMHLAHDSSDARGFALAREVAATVEAPEWVKAAAQVLVQRFALIGQSLPQLAATLVEAGSTLSKAQGRPIVIYSWASDNTSSILRAKLAASQASANAILVGLCLDSNVAVAKAQVAANGLPGEQIYDSAGADGKLARKLVLTEPGLVYLIDQGGIIRSVAVQNTLSTPVANMP